MAGGGNRKRTASGCDDNTPATHTHASHKRLFSFQHTRITSYSSVTPHGVVQQSEVAEEEPPEPDERQQEREENLDKAEQCRAEQRK